MISRFQRFIERYQQLEASGMAKDSIFKAVADSLKEEGVELVTLEERIQVSVELLIDCY